MKCNKTGTKLLIQMFSIKQPGNLLAHTGYVESFQYPLYRQVLYTDPTASYSDEQVSMHTLPTNKTPVQLCDPPFVIGPNSLQNAFRQNIFRESIQQIHFVKGNCENFDFFLDISIITHQAHVSWVSSHYNTANTSIALRCLF